MPVTKTAKRALRVSKRKEQVNKKIIANFEVALRLTKKNKTKKSVSTAISFTDRMVKKHLIHKNKAARIKSSLSKLLVKSKTTKSNPKKTSGKR